MAPNHQPAEATQEINGAGRRQSNRLRKAAPKVAELNNREIEAQEAYHTTVALAAARAEKRPWNYSVDELEEIIAKRQRVELDAEARKQAPVHPPLPPPPQHAHSGINLDFVNRVRNKAAIPTTTTAIMRVTDCHSNVDRWHFQAPGSMMQPAASSHSHHPAPPAANRHPCQIPNQDLPLIGNPEADLGRPPIVSSPNSSNPPMNPSPSPSFSSPSSLSLPASPSPAQCPVRPPPLDPNNNPESPSYGDGPGNLLPPRRLHVRTVDREEFKSVKGKEQKAAHNQARVRTSDYPILEGSILETATARFIAVITCSDPFPVPEKEVALAEQCWDWAQRFHSSRITHDKGLITLLRQNLVNHRTQVSSTSANLIKGHYKFDDTSHPTEETKARNTAHANRILKDDGYIFGDIDARDDPYENGLILELSTRLWLHGKRAAGVLNSDLFLPGDSIPVPLLAYVLTILEKALKEWVPGARKTISLTPDSHRERLQYHIHAIKNYREYPGAEAVYLEVMKELNTAFRNKVNEYAPPAQTTNGARTNESGSGLKPEDIQNAISRRQARRAAVGVNAPPSTGIAQTAAPVLSDAAVPLGCATVPAPNNGMHLNLPLGFVLTSSDTLEPEPPQIESMGSTVSTIYPEDSVSQHVPVDQAEKECGVAQGAYNEQQMGYLAQLNGRI